MYTNVNLESVVGALGLLGASFLLAVLGLVFVHALLVRRHARARAAFAAGVLIAGLYAALTLGFSLASSEKVLAAGTEKYFCELDCHLAYSVVGVRRAKTLGGATPAGAFYVVTLRTRFDAETTSLTRDDRPLTPNPRRVEITDEQGRAFGPSELGQRALAAAGAAGLPLDTPLRPGQSYTTELVFDLPPDARGAALLVNESALPTRFTIGHENSLLHRKTRFSLEL
jgi:hypothetical protein